MTNGIRVAIIDSGLDRRDKLLAEHCVEGVAIRSDGEETVYSSCFDDQLGHGTACARALTEVTCDVQIVVVKIFHEHLKCPVRTLRQGIEWALSRDVEALNLSLGTTDLCGVSELASICKLADQRDVAIVAAEHNAMLKSYPACFPFAFKAIAAVLIDPKRYYSIGHEPNRYALPARRQIGVADDLSQRWCSGNSIAAATLSGIIAKIMKKDAAMSLPALREEVGRRAAGRVEMCDLVRPWAFPFAE